MPVIRERALDHGGRSFTLDAERGGRVVIVVNGDGTREVHMYGRGGHEPDAALRMDSDDARRLGAVLGGTRLRPAIPAAVRDRVGHLAVDWVRVDASSGVVGLSLQQLDIPRRTGMTVLAIVRGDETLHAPSATDALAAGDRVVVIGQLRQMPLVQDLLTGVA